MRPGNLVGGSVRETGLDADGGREHELVEGLVEAAAAEAVHPRARCLYPIANPTVVWLAATQRIPSAVSTCM